MKELTHYVGWGDQTGEQILFVFLFLFLTHKSFSPLLSETISHGATRPVNCSGPVRVFIDPVALLENTRFITGMIH